MLTFGYGTNPVHLSVVAVPVQDGLTGGWKGVVSDMKDDQEELIAKPPKMVLPRRSKLLLLFSVTNHWHRIKRVVKCRPTNTDNVHLI